MRLFFKLKRNFILNIISSGGREGVGGGGGGSTIFTEIQLSRFLYLK